MKKLRYNNDGQGLMELLIALSVLVISLVATIVLIITSIEAGRESRNKLTGTNFAREGIEIVRNIRDSNWIDPGQATMWNEGLDIGPRTAPLISHVWDTEPISLVTITGFDDSNAAIWYSPSEKRYLQASVALPSDREFTGFYRVVYLSHICHDSVGTEYIVAKELANDCTSFSPEGNGDFGEVGVRVIAEVRWPTWDSNRKVVIEERLYNWQAL